MNTLKLTLLAGAATVMMAGSSQALTASGGSISLNNRATDYNAPIGVLSKFNSAAGTLTAVSFTVGYGFNSTIRVSATTKSTGNVSTESAAQFSSSDTAVNAVLGSVVNTTSAIIGSATLIPAAYDLTGTRSIYTITPATGPSSQTYTSSASGTTTDNAAASRPNSHPGCSSVR